MLPKQVINVVPAGAGVGEMKEEYGRSLQILLAVCGAGAAHRLRQRRQPAAGARASARRGQTARAAGARRVAAADRVAGAAREPRARDRRRHRRALIVAAAPPPAAVARVPADAHFLPISHAAVARSCWPSPLALAARHRHPVRRGAGVVRDAHRSGREPARRGPQHARPLVAGPQCAARRAGHALRRARRRRDDARRAASTSSKRQDFGYEVDGRVVVSLNRPPATYTPPMLASIYRRLEERLNRLPGVTGSGLALYNPLTDNWGEMVFVAGPSAAEDGRRGRRVLGSRQRALPAEFRRRGRARPRVHGGRQRDLGARRRRERGVREALLQGRRGSARTALRPRLSRERRTFRIVGVVRDAKFAGWGLSRPARPMFYVPLAQTVDYART